MHNRRDFLKLLGLAVGTTLAGCGGSNSAGVVAPGFSPAPNAYRFIPVVGSGGTLAGQRAVLAQGTSNGGLPFIGAVMVNDRRHVCFHATDQEGSQGVYQVDYESDGNLSPIEPLIVEGDRLEDGTVVDTIYAGDLNNADDTVFVVKDPEGKQTLQYSESRAPFQRLLTPYDDLSSEVRLYGDLQSYVALSGQGDMMLVCNYRTEDGYADGEGLVYIPNKSASSARLVLSKDQLLPGTASAVRTFGLYDLRPGGDYLVLGSAALLEGSPDDNSGPPPTYLLRGRVGEEPETLVAHPSLGSPSAIPGFITMGPRLSAEGFGAVVQTDENHTALWIDQEKILDADFAQGGSLSPRGAKIFSMFPPVFGPNGLVFVEVFTSNGAELLVYDGQGFSTVLATGDTIGGKQVDMILFGALPHCVNSLGELVAVVEYTNGESAVILGMPV
jgi:hypothetical protein